MLDSVGSSLIWSLVWQRLFASRWVALSVTKYFKTIMLKGTQSPNKRIYTSVVAVRRQQLFLKIELFLEVVNINFDILLVYLKTRNLLIFQNHHRREEIKTIH